ncbi:hypothetical protein [Pandoraea sp. PE-S2T-3]|uniref:hypothetical protein n=1 Tax=Pandoraea sp. PE-S2T-3 TaxID=1986993 RepID=UPI000B3FE3AD|nr:hypothetical protein [Pandoraea sp. PE-S2T-3]
MSKFNQYSGEKVAGLIKEFANSAKYSSFMTADYTKLIDELDAGTRAKLGDAFTGLNDLAKDQPKISLFFVRFKAVSNLMKNLESYVAEMAQGDVPPPEEKRLIADINVDLKHFSPGQTLGEGIFNLRDDHGTEVSETYTGRWTDKGPTVGVVGMYFRDGKFEKEARIDNAVRESREDVTRELLEKLGIATDWTPTHRSYDFPMASFGDAHSRVAGSEQVTSTAPHHLTGAAKLAYLAQSVIALRANDIGIVDPAALAAYPPSGPVLLAASH